jgi:hypothetical protein
MESMAFRSLRRKLDIRHWLMVATLAMLPWLGTAAMASAGEDATESAGPIGNKQIIGATATVEEVKTDLLFKARVDTGATTSSLHVEDYVIKDEAKKMVDNVGRKIRFRIKNYDGESKWMESKIAKVSLVKTSADLEQRYKVPLTLRVHKVQKRVLVTLNDRSQMKYPMLLGRNFLTGDFVVDVDSKKVDSKKVDSKKGQGKKTDLPAKKKSPSDKPAKEAGEEKASA